MVEVDITHSPVREERETLIRWSEDDSKIFVYSMQRPVITKLKRSTLFEPVKEICTEDGRVIGIEGYLPLRHPCGISIRRVNKGISKEQRKEFAESKKKIHGIKKPSDCENNSLSKYECETLFGWSDSEKRIYVYTTQMPMMRKMLKNPLFELYELILNWHYSRYLIGFCGYLPLGTITIRLKKRVREVTDEQREQFRERMKKSQKTMRG